MTLKCLIYYGFISPPQWCGICKKNGQSVCPSQIFVFALTCTYILSDFNKISQMVLPWKDIDLNQSCSEKRRYQN